MMTIENVFQMVSGVNVVAWAVFGIMWVRRHDGFGVL